ncbi:MAG TPA: hypothetical protein VMV95_03345 [Bacillota bacterium]|nr:hypothetical protein [Bacillota bacterium]
MIKETIQEGLFQPHSEVPNINNDVAFGVTKTGLLKGCYGALENIFYGMHNLEIPLEMLSIENSEEILANFFAAGDLKKGNLHINPYIPIHFLELVNYMNKKSYINKGFLSLAHNFETCFDNSPGKQRERLESLDKQTKNRFVFSFFKEYKCSNKENSFNYSFYNPNCDGRSKEVYADMIYQQLKFLSDQSKEVQFLNFPLFKQF